MAYSKQSGFTLLELLLIVAFCGLLASLLITVFRGIGLHQIDIAKINDARRLSDGSQMVTGLDLYSSHAGGYPDTSLWVAGATLGCNGNAIMIVPRDPINNSAHTYIYKGKGKSSDSNCGMGSKVWSDYSVQFETEGDTHVGPAGTYCLTPNRGIAPGACP